ncbi:MAG: hypothetical protein HLUCCA05_12070 [Roseibaca calidilacus]|uniref:Uncharacterized protein n=1 Tax=Roseibaca calidilacus TaxID=1666912 RepID=A0A0P7YZ92_9RHOB|nr:dimethylamine monooxygenase subunit DmmA family protein [Roseibaca calidilacus]KPP94550.1 MAG: hypothetical protein HLUCCA05_12070 [Roseibaca calidilacus]CUX83215.1 hypothetical protein Ga0058931_2847 [Roseibaca calidilacus]
MSTFDFPPSIASRPTYGKLAPRAGAAQIMLADAEGAEALLSLAKANPDLMRRAHVIYIPKDTGTGFSDQLRAAAPDILHIAPSYAACTQRLQRVFSAAPMGAQFYLAGTEGLIGQAIALALQIGIPKSAIQTEHRGSVARRVQCVHCKGITEEVMTDPFQCGHCGLNLFVRDHYSRRLAAFQGVCIDAEDPGNVPPSVELYS